MRVITNITLALEPNETLVTADQIESTHIEVFYKGQKLTNITGIIVLGWDK